MYKLNITRLNNCRKINLGKGKINSTLFSSSDSRIRWLFELNCRFITEIQMITAASADVKKSSSTRHQTTCRFYNLARYGNIWCIYFRIFFLETINPNNLSYLLGICLFITEIPCHMNISWIMGGAYANFPKQQVLKYMNHSLTYINCIFLHYFWNMYVSFLLLYRRHNCFYISFCTKPDKGKKKIITLGSRENELFFILEYKVFFGIFF